MAGWDPNTPGWCRCQLLKQCGFCSQLWEQENPGGSKSPLSVLSHVPRSQNQLWPPAGVCAELWPCSRSLTLPKGCPGAEMRLLWPSTREGGEPSLAGSSWKLLAHKARLSLHQNALKEPWRMGRVNVRAALSVPAFTPCTANTCSGYKWVHEEFISFAVSGLCIPLLIFLSTEGYHSCFVLCCPSPPCALFLSLLQQSHLGIHKTPIKFSLPQVFQEQKNACFTSQTFWCGGEQTLC